jgi:hypothetical protein
MPAADSSRPFMNTLIEDGTLILRDDASIPTNEKLFMSVRVRPTDRLGENWLVLEHATRARSPLAERKFSRYWH